MTRHVDNSDVCISGCAALWSLADTAANGVSIAEAGGIGPVAAALTRHGDNSGVCQAACGALWGLAGNAANRISIA